MFEHSDSLQTSHLHELACILAAKQLLLLYCSDFASRHRWNSQSLKDLSQLDAELQLIIACLNQAFIHTMTIAESNALEQNYLSYVEIMQLEILKSRFGELRLRQSYLEITRSSSEENRITHIEWSPRSQLRKIFPGCQALWCTDLLVMHTQVEPENRWKVRLKDVDYDTEDYQNAVEQIGALLSRMQQETSTKLDDLGRDSAWIAFVPPISHLAYWNGDIDLALKLSMESDLLGFKADILGRTLVHLATETGNLGTLQLIVDKNSKAIGDTGPDAWGCYPLDTATISNNFDVFGLLLARGAYIRSPEHGEQSLLDIAVDTGSLSIVKHIVEHPMTSRPPYTIALPPYTRVAMVAVEKGFEEIARYLLPWLLDESDSSRLELNYLADQAERNGLFGLAADFRCAIVTMPGADDALVSLRQVAESHLCAYLITQGSATPAGLAWSHEDSI